MLNLALVALLSGTLAIGTPDGDGDKDKTPAPQPEATVAADGVQSILTQDASADPRAITNDTYAFGRAADAAPIKAWVAYAFGEAEAPYWRADGEEATDAQDFGDISSQRAIVGAQINVINFPAFKVGIGGQLVAGQNKFQTTAGGELDSGFGLQQAKAFLGLRGDVVGIHGAYLFDLADELTDPTTEFPLSDQRDAIQVGADFDYPAERVRLFGGIDYFILQDDDATTADDGGNNILWWNAGAGLRFGFFEIGAALQIRTVFRQGTAFAFTQNPSGGHAGTVAPYLKVSPPSLPVSLFVKGAVLNEYTDYGYAIGGANDIKPGLGFTAGLTLGFY